MAPNVAYHLYGLDSVNYEKEEVKKFVPTLFIGLGGTGKQILLRFRRSLAEQYVTWREGFARFLAIDTDDQPVGDQFDQVAFRRDLGEMMGCSISQQEYRTALEAFRKRYDRRFADWLHPDFESLVPPTAVQNGAGTYRQAGRLAFFLKFSLIKDQILQHMKAALHFAAQRPQTLFGQPGEVFEDRLEVVIVTSLAGGTGSGMLLDTAYLVRHLMDTTPDFGRITLHTTLIGMLPNAFTNVSPVLSLRFQQNAYAALLEMEHFNTPRPADAFGRLRPGASGQLDRPVFRVNWSDPTGADLQIGGRPWDTCYLIDDAHDQQRTKQTTTEEIYQLVADYLFLDFGNNPFAIAKRSARSNHTQLTDRTLATQVLRQPPVSSVSRGVGEPAPAPVVVYENYYGCTYSSFGLSEIQIDRDRVVRAAGYCLAKELIKHCWLGQRNIFTGSDYKRFVQEDLLGKSLPRGESASMDFSRSALFEQLVSHPEKHLRSATKEEFQNLARLNSHGRFQAALNETLDRLKEAVSISRDREPGLDYQLMVSKGRRLQGGGTISESPLCQRLRLLMRERCERLGIVPTQQVIEDLYVEFDKAAKASREDVAKAKAVDDDVAYRLEDAHAVPWPCKEMAMRIEYRRALPLAETVAWSRYEVVAWGLVDRIYIQLRDYVGNPKVLEFAAGPTLWRESQLTAEFLEQIAIVLESRFQSAVSVQGSERKQALMPTAGEDGANYTKMIHDALYSNTRLVGPDQNDHGGQTAELRRFDWQRAEQAILDRIPTVEGQLGGWTRMDLIEAYERDFRSNRDRLPGIVETLSRACADLLRESLELKDLAGGNVVNYLKASGTPNIEQRYQDFVSSSGVHFPMLAASVRGTDSFRPAWRTILGCTPSADQEGVRRAAEVEQSIRAKVETEKTGDPAQNKIHDTKALMESKLVLMRELAGVPLHVFDRLKSLSAAYFDPSIAQQRMTAHLRYNEGFEELPDIEEVAGEEYDKIQRNILSVIRGILLEFLNYQPDSGRFMIELTDARRSATTRVNLGTRLPRVLQHAATRPQVVAFLSQQWQEWYDKVSKGHPEYLALLYCATQLTLEEFPHEVNFRTELTAIPLQTCLEELLAEVEQLLEATPEGQRLLRMLKKRSEMDLDQRVWREWYPQLCQQLVKQGVLVRLGDQLPFHTVNWRRLSNEGSVDATQLGFVPPANLSVS